MGRKKIPSEDKRKQTPYYLDDSEKPIMDKAFCFIENRRRVLKFGKRVDNLYIILKEFVQYLKA